MTYRFRAKIRPACGAENDIAARRRQSCDQLLADPDDKLKEAPLISDRLWTAARANHHRRARANRGTAGSDPPSMSGRSHPDGSTSAFSTEGCAALVSNNALCVIIGPPGPGA